MVRLFHVYYPVRRLVLLGCEAIIVFGAFVAATFLALGPDAPLALNYENGFAKLLTITAVVLLMSHYFDLYGPQYLVSRGETYFRLMIVLALLSFVLAVTSVAFPSFVVGPNVFLFGLITVTVVLVIWRGAYEWVIQRPSLQERVYVIGTGERAERLVNALRNRKDLGIDVIGWAGALGNGTLTRDNLVPQVQALANTIPVDRVILALADRRGTMPVREMLDLRLRGVKIEEASTLLEKIQGKIEVDDLYPSSLIFSGGFRLNTGQLLARRVLSIAIATTAFLVCLPAIPLIALAITLTSPGPVLFSQQRIGRRGETFTIFKFRTMRQDAEAQTGAVWARKNDPRVTSIGRFMRKTRLDEIPQLWNVLRGDMAFVGPRPERPEFVQWLVEKIPYYNLRHIIRPGLTGWAQVRYQYGASTEEAKQKVQYDLYYIKHMSVSLDMLILFETMKTVILRRGQ